jgi:hypothetical protein
MRNFTHLSVLLVLTLHGIGCSGTSSSTDSGTSSSQDTKTSDPAVKEGGVADSQRAADAVGAPCRSNPSTTCAASTTGFICSGSAEPETTSMCPEFHLTTNPDEFSLCCALKPASSTCSKDPSVSCAAPSTGYTCSGPDSPAQSNLVICDAGTPSNGKKAFCCRDFVSTSCKIDISLTGCIQKYPFSCTGTQTPADVDPGLQCSKGTEFGGTDAIGFCCSVKK